MLESHLDLETIQNTAGVNFIHSTNQTLFLPREPSFSGWCNEHSLVHLDCQVEFSDASGDDFDFGLPLLHESESRRTLESSRNQCITFQKGSMQLNGDSTTDLNSKDGAGGRNGTDRYVPFDIENRHAKKISLSDNGAHDSTSIDNGGTLPPNTKSSIFAADVLKTLFLILMWYTFSTFLTLYNKTLLGDDMGKFPAPLLMNTVHFSMQAVLSKAITWFWSHRFQPSVAMSWRDYFVRDGLCLAQLYRRLWRQLWMLT